MKKFLTFSSVVTMSVIVAAPVVALAAGLVLPTPPPTGSAPGLTGSGIVNIITTAVNYLITIAVVVAVAMFIYGGVQFAMGGAEKGKGILTNAAIGLLAILGVGLLINTIAGLVSRGLNLG
jgi:hypothetical protein